MNAHIHTILVEMASVCHGPLYTLPLSVSAKATPTPLNAAKLRSSAILNFFIPHHLPSRSVTP